MSFDNKLANLLSDVKVCPGAEGFPIPWPIPKPFRGAFRPVHEDVKATSVTFQHSEVAVRLRLQTAVVPVIVSSLLAACGGGEGGAGAVATRDSAGIRIVENAGAELAEGEGWALTAEPIVQIGGDAANPAYDFNRIAGVVRLGDGTIAVANGISFEVRFYSSSGAHRSSTGRMGAGPGEFQAITAMWRSPADSLVVLDVGLRRLTMIGADGGVGHIFSLGGVGGAMMPGADGSMSLAIPAGMLADGSLIGADYAFRINDAREGSFRDSIPVIRYGADGAVRDTVARVPGVEMEMMTMSFGGQSFASPSPVMLGRNTIVAAAGDRFYLALNERWEVEVRSPDGTLTALYRVADAARPLSAADIAAHREEQIENLDAQLGLAGASVPPQIREQMVERIHNARYPPALPFVANMLVDQTGHLWVQEVPVPGDQRQRWGVFTQEGRLLTWLRMPPRFRPTYVDDDALIGIWQDDDDVEYVRVYGLTRGEG